MYIDSHCHVDFPQLAENVDAVLANMQQHQVQKALVVSVCLEDWPRLIQLVEQHPEFYASVGVHPGYDEVPEPTYDDLSQRAQHPKVIAIGETGLDYYRLTEPLDWQRERFALHLQVSKDLALPSIIHTRNAYDDTIAIMKAADSETAGVMHCFGEDWEAAKRALDLGYYISLSGIVTFKNAPQVHEVAKKVPLDRLLIETDSPYLAPVPYRGKTNEPAWVLHVAEHIAQLRGESAAQIAQAINYFIKLKRFKGSLCELNVGFRY